VTVESSTLVEEIRALLEASPAREREPYLDRLEHTLASGYAQALALEAERWRLERRIGDLASGLDQGDAGADKNELARLSRHAARTDRELTRIRGLLASLRTRASALRSGAAFVL
jgi:hypothetical protein